MVIFTEVNLNENFIFCAGIIYVNYHQGLHLNPHGNTRLALNLKATIGKPWSKFGNLGNPGYHSGVTSVSSDHNFQKLNHFDINQPEKSTFFFQGINDKSCENSNRRNATETLRNLRLENPDESSSDS